MKKPTLALSAVVRTSLVVLSTVVLAACGSDMTSAPKSSMHAQDATKALVGVVDGVYAVTINPSVDQVLSFGPNNLTIPANAVCEIGTSSYGPSYWDAPCTPQTAPVTISAIVRNANTNSPSIEFSPALRFNPAKTAWLSLYVTNAETLSSLAVVKYCGVFAPTCVDESLADASLATVIDRTAGRVSRRVKHFSGYVVAE